MTQWYRIKEYSTRDTHYDSDALMFPLEAIVRVAKGLGAENGWFDAVTLEAHPDLNDLNDRPLYLRYYFAARLQPIDDLEVFRITVERSKHHENTNTTATTTE